MTVKDVTVNEPPSQTALTAAAARAAHLIVDDQPLIFNDHLAATLLGEKADDLISYHRLHGSHGLDGRAEQDVREATPAGQDSQTRCHNKTVRCRMFERTTMPTS